MALNDAPWLALGRQAGNKRKASAEACAHNDEWVRVARGWAGRQATGRPSLPRS